MPIVFDEVSAEIEPTRGGEDRQDSLPRQEPAPAEDFDARLARALRLREERLARLCDQ